MDSSHYDADYYCNGRATGKSNYQDYRWIPDLTLPMADILKRTLHVREDDTVLDVGAARGYLVKALRMRGVNAHGYDFSEWAVSNCDEAVKGYMTTDSSVLDNRWDHVICKDTLEHVPLEDLKVLVKRMIAAARKSVLLIVPLTYHDDGPYLRDEDNADPSHVIAWPLQTWMQFMHEHFTSDEGFLTGSWHYPGLKPASSQVPQSCGFLQFNRL